MILEVCRVSWTNDYSSCVMENTIAKKSYEPQVYDQKDVINFSFVFTSVFFLGDLGYGQRVPRFFFLSFAWDNVGRGPDFWLLGGGGVVGGLGVYLEIHIIRGSGSQKLLQFFAYNRYIFLLFWAPFVDILKRILY